jgi:adenosylhomocysteine nucleosidase
MNTVLILTALELERQAVLTHLKNIQQELHPDTGTDYNIGYYDTPTGKVKVVVGKTDQTNTNAGIETERALSHFSPSHAFFVGVAGGLKDVKVGDIVIGKAVFGYERGKETDEGFRLRPQHGYSSYDLERIAESYGNSAEWKTDSSILVNTEFSSVIDVYSGTIAAGEKVMTNINSETLDFLRKNVGNALAIEMEGLGFLEACRPYTQIKSLLLRGISDLIKGKDGSDEKGSQPYASQNVSRFLFGLIERIPFEISASDLKNKILEAAYKLYPKGVEDNNIWERAGGQLHKIRLTVTGGEQWYEALRLIERGVGEITFFSLIQMMKYDFPKNQILKSIRY